VHLVRDLDYFR